MAAAPFELEDEVKYSRLSMPVSCCSMTWVTVLLDGLGVGAGVGRGDADSAAARCRGYAAAGSREDREEAAER